MERKPLSYAAMFGSLASCGHPRNSDGECYWECSYFPEPAPNAATILDEMALVQRLAEAHYFIAISDNRNYSPYDSGPYVASEAAFLYVLKETYHLSDDEGDKVSSLLSEYGYEETLMDTHGAGIFSFVQYALDDRNYS